MCIDCLLYVFMFYINLEIYKMNKKDLMILFVYFCIELTYLHDL